MPGSDRAPGVVARAEELPVNVGTLGREHLRRVSHLHRDAIPGWSAGESWWRRSPVVIVAVLLGVITLVLRLVYGAAAPTDATAAQLVAGSSRFDVTAGAPAAPGSWLYVAAGRLVHDVTGFSAVHSLVLLAALASAGTAAAACLAGSALGGRAVGVAVGALVASAPVSWLAGSTVAVSGFGALVSAVALLLARRARPYSAHGVVALSVVGLGAGVHLSVALEALLLVLVAVVSSVRTVGQLLAMVVAAAASVAVWLVPVMFVQSGGLHAWFRALHAQISDAAHSSSVFSAPASGALTNLGVTGGWSVVTLGPVAVLSVLGALTLIVARIVTRRPAGTAAPIWGTSVEAEPRVEWPWYQSTGTLLFAALAPPLAFALLGQYGAAGGVLAFIVPATVLLVLPVGRLLHHRSPGLRRAAVVVAAVVLGAIVVVNIQRFVAAPGILPAGVTRDHPGLWLSKARYQSPYPATADAIRSADRTAAALGRLRAMVDPHADVVLCTGTTAAATTVYRTIDALYPDLRVALVDPFRSTEVGGLVSRAPLDDLEVAPGGHAVVLTTADDPTLVLLAATGLAARHRVSVGPFTVWSVDPGANLYGLAVRTVPAPAAG
ncbi:MAG TPA: hypothetical protein VMF60_09440 [Acidimicrobiales bacterium]|nr:hypothetical protein [Acidimicrobiales bacterium]